MRALETIHIRHSPRAETGCWVIGTCTRHSASKALDRIIDVIGGAATGAAARLGALSGVVSQHLAKARQREGRVAGDGSVLPELRHLEN